MDQNRRRMSGIHVEDMAGAFDFCKKERNKVGRQCAAVNDPVQLTKYDKEGYLIQFYKGVLLCNTLAAMWSSTEAAFTTSELAALPCRVIAFDERTMRGEVNAMHVMKKYSALDTKVVVGLVGIQTNMFPRARHLALEFKAQGCNGCDGRISHGSITMLHDGTGDSKIPCPCVMSAECAELMEQGVILFHGEAEGIWHEVLGDIVRGEEKQALAP